MALNDSAELLALIRRRGSIPSNAPDWTASVVLELASRKLLEHHFPLLVAARGEYLVKTTDFTFVPGTERYRLPARCASVRLVSYLQADGQRDTIEEASPVELDQLGANINRQGRPSRFTFAEHAVTLWPIPGSGSDKMRVKWHIRPSRIVENTNAAAITLIETDTPSAGQTRLTFAAPGGALFPGTTAKTDIVKASSPFDLIGYDLTPLSGTATTRVFTSSQLPTDLEVGDFISGAGYTPFANVPVELHLALALRTAAAIITAKDDSLAKRLEDEAIAAERSLLIGILAPRSKGNPKRIISRHWS